MGGSLEAAIVKVLVALPRVFVKNLQSTMFEKVMYTNRMANSPTVLKGNEDTAFDAIGAKAVDIKHVLGRAFAVNFFDSFTDLHDLIAWLDPPSSSQSTPTA